jgi:hypothetical protein
MFVVFILRMNYLVVLFSILLFATAQFAGNIIPETTPECGVCTSFQLLLIANNLNRKNVFAPDFKTLVLRWVVKWTITDATVRSKIFAAVLELVWRLVVKRLNSKLLNGGIFSAVSTQALITVMVANADLARRSWCWCSAPRF